MLLANLKPTENFEFFTNCLDWEFSFNVKREQTQLTTSFLGFIRKKKYCTWICDELFHSFERILKVTLHSIEKGLYFLISNLKTLSFWERLPFLMLDCESPLIYLFPKLWISWHNEPPKCFLQQMLTLNSPPMYTTHLWHYLRTK